MGNVKLGRNMHYSVTGIVALVGLLGVFGQAALADGDPAAGKTIFAKCMVCHSPDAGVNKVGPSLHGIVGRPSHSIVDYNYSPAMQAYNVTWDEVALDKYLVEPRAVVVGTKMIFAGIKKDQDRQNLIAYLKTLK